MIEPMPMTILTYPDKRLRDQSHPVDMLPEEQPNREAIVESMKRALIQSRDGVALSAIQVGAQARLFIIDEASDGAASPRIRAYFNPEIIKFSDELVTMDEGCLSFPGFFVGVERPARVTVKAQRVDGTEFEMDAQGLVARAIQHEMDHLDGKLLIDRITSPVKREMAKRRMVKKKSLQTKPARGTVGRRKGSKKRRR